MGFKSVFVATTLSGDEDDGPESAANARGFQSHFSVERQRVAKLSSEEELS